MTEAGSDWGNPLWAPTLSRLREENPGVVPEEVFERADTWGRGLEVSLPDEQKSPHGVPRDSILAWLAIRFSHAIADGDYKQASNIHRLFSVRANEVASSDGKDDPFLFPTTTEVE